MPGTNPGTTGLEGFWGADETSGTRSDEHGSNDLSDNNSVLVAPARVGANAARFVRADSQYLSIADNASLSMGDIDFTLGALVYIESKTGFGIVMGKWGASAPDLE